MPRKWFAISLFTLSSAFVGCSGGEAPPLDELALRDALGASPASLALLSDTQLRALAERLEVARRTQSGAEPIEPKLPEEDVHQVDDTRKGRGEDALVAGVEVNSSIEARSDEIASSNDPLPPLEGTPATDTAVTETQALDGRAGSIVLDLLRTSGAKRIERVVQWPIGAVAIGDTVYVNASWLVAMASLETGDAGARPTLQPAALQGNPYNTYSSLAACTTDVSMRCDACVTTGGCDEKATLSDFGDGRAECEWLVADKARIAQLCATALMSLSTVAHCVRDRSGCSISNAVNTVAGISSAAAFLAETRCVQALNACLSGDSPSTVVFVDGGTGAQPTAAPPAENKGCQDPFSSCASAWKGCDKACKSGSCSGSNNGERCSNTSSSSSCSSCNSNNGDACGCKKSSTSSSSSRSGSSSNNCGSCKDCQTAPSPVEPFLTPAALLAPLLYLAVRSRRRA